MDNYIDYLNDSSYPQWDWYGNPIQSTNDDDIYIVDRYGNVNEDNSLEKYNSTEHHIIY